jgi:hypothetical protein
MQVSGIRMLQPNAIAGQGAQGAPWLARFAGKVVLDVLPAVLASVIGGFLFTQYHFGHTAAPPLVAVQPASPEMMAMVRDEHALIMDYLKAQMVAEKRRDAAEDAATARAVVQAHASADAKLADALMVSQEAQRASVQPVAAAKVAPSVHRKTPAFLTPAVHAPLAIAQANQAAPMTVAEAEGADDRLARDPDSLLAKTLDLKDHVVAATRHVVSAIGDVVSSIGGSIGGVMSSAARPFNSAS